MEPKEVDKCLTCGKEYESKLWGAACDCDNPNVVHLGKCDSCGAKIGYMSDDDYVGIGKLYCPDCIQKSNSAE